MIHSPQVLVFTQIKFGNSSHYSYLYKTHYQIIALTYHETFTPLTSRSHHVVDLTSIQILSS